MIQNFFLHPTQFVTGLLTLSRNKKLTILASFLILYYLFINILTYIGIKEVVIWIETILLSFKSIFLGLCGFTLFSLTMHYFWQKDNGQAEYIDIALVSSYSMIVSEIILFIFTIVGYVLVSNIIIALWAFASFWWLLVVYSKSISTIQKFSETIVLKHVVLSGLLYLFFTWVYYFFK